MQKQIFTSIIPKATLFDIPITNVSMTDAISQLMAFLDQPKTKQIFFLNAHAVNISRNDPEYLKFMQQADAVYGDGIGIRLASRLLKQQLFDNVNGTDLYPRLCYSLQKSGHRIFLLGAKPGIAEKMKELTEELYPGIQIVGTQHGFFSEDETPVITKAIRAARTNLLLVALGIPAQEKWIATHARATGAQVAIGVGGLFNFYSGTIPRAPLWMRKAGLEWLHRLYREPRRLWRRYLIGNAKFLGLTFREGLRNK